VDFSFPEITRSSLQREAAGFVPRVLQRGVEWPFAPSAFRKKILLFFESRLKSAEQLPFFPVLTTSHLNRNGWSMRKLLLGMALTIPIAFLSPAPLSPATALPLAHPLMHGAAVNADLVEVKGGRGHGHGWGRGHGYRPFGWSRGRKVGWRGRGCPPGHWKKGWC
jgi:hypothetical protein